MQIEMPDRVRQIIRRLTEAGYEAYIVGGCVRDAILGRRPSDWDVTTNAKPDQVKALFPRTVDTGIQHGTVTVLLNREGFEVTTYRIDGEYQDGRHPKEVTFTPSLLEDLKRRDFTINAMAYNESEGLVDAFDGMGDLKRRRICCVGGPKERFAEDALRILRAVRFAAQLNFSIEEETREAICEFAPQLARISAERIQTEIVKLLTSAHPEAWRIVYETGISAVILPEFDVCMETPQNNPHHCFSVGEHILHSLTEIEADKVLRLTMLFHDIGKPRVRFRDEGGVDHFKGHGEVSAEIARSVLRRLKFDNETIRRVKHLVNVHDALLTTPTLKGMRRAVFQIGEDCFSDYLKVRRADIMAQNPRQREEKLENLERMRSMYLQVLREKSCLSLKDLAVTGKDLMEAGMPPGPELGAALKRLLDLVVENPHYNTKERLLELAKASEEK